MPEPQPAALVTTASTSLGERVEVAAGERRACSAAPVCIASAPQQPCAARDDRLDAVARQHAQRRPADVGREHLLRAAGQQRDARRAARPAAGWTAGSGRAAGSALGQQVEHRAPATRAAARASGRREPARAARRSAEAARGGAACAGPARAGARSIGARARRSSA